MMLVAEGHRLVTGCVDFGEVGRLVDLVRKTADRSPEEYEPVNADFGEGVRAAMEYLGHRVAFELREQSARSYGILLEELR